jgi:uncharacterized membrane protein
MVFRVIVPNPDISAPRKECALVNVNMFALAAGIGFVSGLRAFTAPAAVSWAAYLGWISLGNSPLAFMGSGVTVAIFSLLAVGEFVGDQLPTTPSRTTTGPLIARILMGGLCGACLCASASESLLVGAALGGIGGVIGAFAGYEARTRLVRGLGVKDVLIAVPEDLVAIGLAYLFVSAR